MYVHGGCADLVGCLLWGKIEWLKDLSIYEGMLRHFNSSMVRYLTTPMVHSSYDTGDSIDCGSMYFILGGVSPGREFPCGHHRGGLELQCTTGWPRQILHGFLSEVLCGHA